MLLHSFHSDLHGGQHQQQQQGGHGQWADELELQGLGGAVDFAWIQWVSGSIPRR